MADALGLTIQAYQRYEYNKHDMKGSMIIKVCAILECSSDWLLGIKDTGAALPPESEVLRNLRERAEQLNVKGQRKLADYAEDLTDSGKYASSKNEVHDDRVSKSA